MSEQPLRSYWFLETLGWDGRLPLVMIGSRFVLALFISKMGAASIVIIFVTPLVAAMRARFANDQIARLGLKRCYGRQISIAGAIVSLTICEIIAVFLLTDPTAPWTAWYWGAGFYAAYLLMLAIALRPAPGQQQRPTSAAPEPGT